MYRAYYKNGNISTLAGISDIVKFLHRETDGVVYVKDIRNNLSSIRYCRFSSVDNTLIYIIDLSHVDIVIENLIDSIYPSLKPTSVERMCEFIIEHLRREANINKILHV